MKTSGLISQPELFTTLQSKFLFGDSLHHTSNAHSITQLSHSYHTTVSSDTSDITETFPHFICLEWNPVENVYSNTLIRCLLPWIKYLDLLVPCQITVSIRYTRSQFVHTRGDDKDKSHSTFVIIKIISNILADTHSIRIKWHTLLWSCIAICPYLTRFSNSCIYIFSF